MLKSLWSYHYGRIERRLWLFFLVVLVVNVFVKVVFLAEAPFWYDEIISLQSAHQEFGHIKHVSEWDNNPPFYYYCLHVWVSLFGDTEFSVRMLSVLSSSLAGAVLFVFCNRFFNKTTAIIASFLYLSSDMLFFYAHEARSYSLTVLLCLMGSWLFFALKEKPDYKHSVLLGLVNFLVIYTHYISGLILLVQGICMLGYLEKKAKIKFLVSSLITLALVLLRFTKKQFLLITAFNSAQHTFWLGKSNFSYLTEVLSEILFNRWMILPLLFVTLGGLALVIKDRKADRFYYVYCVLAGFGSVGILYCLGKITPIFLDRYLLFSVPFVMVTIACALSLTRYPIVPLILALGWFGFSLCQINYRTDKGMDYRNAVRCIRSLKKPTDLVIVKTKDVRPLFGYYYDRTFLKMRKEKFDESEHILFCDSWADVDQDVTTFKKVIVVDSYQELNPMEEDFKAKLSEKKPHHVASCYYKGVRISVYQ